MDLITAADLASFAPDLDTSNFNATTISGIISQASGRILGFCHVDGLALGTYDEEERAKISNNGELIISTRVRPVQTVNTVTLRRGAFSTTLVLQQNTAYGMQSLYQIPSPGNRIHIPNSYLYLTGTFLAGGTSQLLSLKAANMFCEVNYTAGYNPIPDDVKDACVLVVRDIINRRYNPIGAQSFTQGRMSANFGSGDSKILAEAKQILMEGGYVRMAAV